VCRAHVQPLHFSDIALERSQCHAAEGASLISGEQQRPTGWSIGAGKRGELTIEILEAERNTQPVLGFEEEETGDGDVRLALRPADGSAHDPSQVRLAISVPMNSALAFSRRATSAGCGSRTVKTVWVVVCERGPLRAPATPLVLSEAR